MSSSPVARAKDLVSRRIARVDRSQHLILLSSMLSSACLPATDARTAAGMRFLAVSESGGRLVVRESETATVFADPSTPFVVYGFGRDDFRKPDSSAIADGEWAGAKLVSRDELPVGACGRCLLGGRTIAPGDTCSVDPEFEVFSQGDPVAVERLRTRLADEYALVWPGPCECPYSPILGAGEYLTEQVSSDADFPVIAATFDPRTRTGMLLGDAQIALWDDQGLTTKVREGPLCGRYDGLVVSAFPWRPGEFAVATRPKSDRSEVRIEVFSSTGEQLGGAFQFGTYPERAVMPEEFPGRPVILMGSNLEVTEDPMLTWCQDGECHEFARPGGFGSIVDFLALSSTVAIAVQTGTLTVLRSVGSDLPWEKHSEIAFEAETGLSFMSAAKFQNHIFLCGEQRQGAGEHPVQYSVPIADVFAGHAKVTKLPRQWNVNCQGLHPRTDQEWVFGPSERRYVRVRESQGAVVTSSASGSELGMEEGLFRFDVLPGGALARTGDERVLFLPVGGSARFLVGPEAFRPGTAGVFAIDDGYWFVPRSGSSLDFVSGDGLRHESIALTEPLAKIRSAVFRPATRSFLAFGPQSFEIKLSGEVEEIPLPEVRFASARTADRVTVALADGALGELTPDGWTPMTLPGSFDCWKNPFDVIQRSRDWVVDMSSIDGVTWIVGTEKRLLRWDGAVLEPLSLCMEHSFQHVTALCADRAAVGERGFALLQEVGGLSEVISIELPVEAELLRETTRGFHLSDIPSTVRTSHLLGMRQGPPKLVGRREIGWVSVLEPSEGRAIRSGLRSLESTSMTHIFDRISDAVMGADGTVAIGTESGRKYLARRCR